jgi:hypothetical protein
MEHTAMDVESPQWEEWEARFTALAETAKQVPATGDIKGAKYHLCLLGDNGFTPEQEFSELEAMAQHKDDLKKVEIDTGYWMDTILFIP